MFGMSRKKVWNSIMRRKRKNHLDLSGREEGSDSGSVCKWDRVRAFASLIQPSAFSLFSLTCRILFLLLLLLLFEKKLGMINLGRRRMLDEINKTNDKCQCSCMFTLIINRTLMNHVSAEASCWRIVSPGYGEMRFCLSRQTRLAVKNHVNC